MLQNKNWHTGSNRQIKFDEIKKIVLDYIDRGKNLHRFRFLYFSKQSMLCLYNMLTWI